MDSFSHICNNFKVKILRKCWWSRSARSSPTKFISRLTCPYIHSPSQRNAIYISKQIPRFHQTPHRAALAQLVNRCALTIFGWVECLVQKTPGWFRSSGVHPVPKGAPRLMTIHGFAILGVGCKTCRGTPRGAIDVYYLLWFCYLYFKQFIWVTTHLVSSMEKTPRLLRYFVLLPKRSHRFWLKKGQTLVDI